MKLTSWMQQTGYVASVTSANVNGEVFETPRAIRMHHHHKTRLMPGAQGVVKVQNDEVITGEVIRPGDHIWLPGEDPTTAEPHRPVEIRSADSRAGGDTVYVVTL